MNPDPTEWPSPTIGGTEPDEPPVTDGPDDPIQFEYDQVMHRFEAVDLVPSDLGVIDAPVDRITIRNRGEHHDGYQFAITATTCVDFLGALNPTAKPTLQEWLHTNRELVADFFTVTYMADINEPDRFDTLDVTFHASVPDTSDRTITAMQTYSFTVLNTTARALQADIASGRIRDLFRQHTNTLVVRTNRTVGYDLPSASTPQAHYDYQLQCKHDAVHQAVDRDGKRLVTDKTAYWLCQALPREGYPELYRFAHKRIGDKTVIARELERAIATGADDGYRPGQRESLHALWNYFTYGADNAD